MNNQEARKVLQRDLQILIDNKSLPDGIEAMKVAISALGAIDQFRWERDVAIKQLGSLGLWLGEKTDKVKDLIDRDNEEEAVYKHESGTFVCPSCGASTFSLVLYGGDFCQHCGKRVKWRGVIK